MDLLPRVFHSLIARHNASEIRRQLDRLSDRGLDDIGLDRDGIASFALQAARGGSPDRPSDAHGPVSATLIGRALGPRSA